MDIPAETIEINKENFRPLWFETKGKRKDPIVDPLLKKLNKKQEIFNKKNLQKTRIRLKQSKTFFRNIIQNPEILNYQNLEDQWQNYCFHMLAIQSNGTARCLNQNKW